MRILLPILLLLLGCASLGACPRVVAGTAAASVRYECQTNCKELLAQCYTLCVGRQEDPS